MLKIKTTPTPYWTKVIEEARERHATGVPPFTTEQKALSWEWVTCACGKQDSRIPRNEEGEPLDDELDNLGNEFYAAVDDDDIDKAEKYLAKIELRSAQILLEQRS